MTETRKADAVTENVEAVSEPSIASPPKSATDQRSSTRADAQSLREGTVQTAQCSSQKGSATRGKGGARTPLGKAGSRCNALKHGLCAKKILLPGESPKEFDAWCQAFRDHYKPVGLPEELDVMELVRLKWCLRRLSDAERAEIELERRYNPRAADRQKVDREEAQAIEAAVDAQASTDIETAQNTQVPVEIPRPGLMDRFDNPVIREKSLRLLKSLKTSIETTYFLPARDRQIIDKVFGVRTSSEIRLVYTFYAEPKRLSSLESFKDLDLPPEERLTGFLTYLDKVIVFYEDAAKRMDVNSARRERLENRVAVVPERSARYRASLEREYERILNRLLRQQQIRKGQPAPPTLNVNLVK